MMIIKKGIRKVNGAELLILTIKNAPGGGNLTRGIMEASIN
jgi:hypothetical protein